MSERILIVAPSWVGDAIMAQPLLARLRAGGAKSIAVLAPAWCGAVWERMAEVDQVLDNPFAHGQLRLGERRRLGRSLAGRYDRAVVLPNSLKSALLPWFAGIPVRTGYHGEQRYLLLNDRRRFDAQALPRLVDRFYALGAPAAAPIRHGDTPPPRLQPNLASRGATVEKYGLQLGRPIAALCPGAEYGPAKRWPTPHFAALARQLSNDGYAIWLFGSKNDAEAATAIAEAVPEAVNLCGATTLGEALDLLSLATVVVTNDSGLMHAAAALARPLVALFGSSSPGYTPPLPVDAVAASIATLSLSCSPCFQRKCPLGHLNCLNQLTPDRIYPLVRAAAPLPSHPLMATGNAA